MEEDSDFVEEYVEVGVVLDDEWMPSAAKKAEPA